MAKQVQLQPGWLEVEGRMAREQFEERARRLYDAPGATADLSGVRDVPSPIPEANQKGHRLRKGSSAVRQVGGAT